MTIFQGLMILDSWHLYLAVVLSKDSKKASSGLSMNKKKSAPAAYKNSIKVFLEVYKIIEEKASY